MNISVIVMFALVAFLTGQTMAADSSGNAFVPKMQSGYRPDPRSDEGGLWMAVEKLEKDIQDSPLLVRNEIINDYIGDIVCRLAGDYCADIRVYIIRNPHFNASMYPNGMMHVWTGLLLRARNEAQLAAVLSHEIAHYLRNHSIERWRSIRRTSSFTSFLNLGLALGGVGDLGYLVNLGALAGLNSYSRGHETEADLYGMKLMTNVGYAPKESAALWQVIIKENENAKHKTSFNIFTASHPSSKDRVKKLLQSAESNYPNSDLYAVHEERYVHTLTPIIRSVLEDEIKMHHYGRTEVLLDYLLDSVFPRAELYYFKGEFHRSRKEEGDIEAAIEAYELATQEADTPAEVYRELGYIYYKRKVLQKAKENFTDYLSLLPDASDRQMIEFYLNAE